MNKTGAALFVLAVTAAWFLWPYNAGPGERPVRLIMTSQQASR